MILNANLRYNGGLDLYFPYRFFRDVLALMTGSSAATVCDKTLDSVVISKLHSVQLPGLADLDPSDIVRLREQEEAFEDFRAIIRRALAGTSSAEAGEASRLLSDEMRRASSVVHEKTRKSTFLSRLRKGAWDFGVGFAATAPFSSSITTAAAVGFSKSALELVRSYIVEGRNVESPLSRHFLVFKPSST